MFNPNSIQSSFTFKEKFFAMDYILVFSILILGIISMFAIHVLYCTGMISSMSTMKKPEVFKRSQIFLINFKSG